MRGGCQLNVMPLGGAVRIVQRGTMGEGDRSGLGKIIAMTRIIGRFTPDVSHVWNVDHRLSVCTIAWSFLKMSRIIFI